jgi:hypothetical protein
MPNPARHLRAADEPDDVPKLLVDPGTGQTFDLEGYVQGLRDELAGAERDLRGWRTRHANLLRDKEAEAEESPVWPAAVRVFDHWRKACKHPGSEWTYDRFELIRPHLERSNKGKGKASKLTPELIARNEEICKLAIDGIAFDPYVTQAKNGRSICHDGLHLIFGSADLLEKRCKMAPVERIREVFPPASGQAPPAPAQASVAGQQRLS